jgi:hypothetical protein
MPRTRPPAPSTHSAQAGPRGPRPDPDRTWILRSRPHSRLAPTPCPAPGQLSTSPTHGPCAVTMGPLLGSSGSTCLGALVRVSQVRLSQVRLSQVRLSQVRLSQVRLSQVRLSQVRLSQVRLSQVRLSQVRLMGSTCQGRLTRLGPTLETTLCWPWAQTADVIFSRYRLIVPIPAPQSAGDLVTRASLRGTLKRSSA